MGFFHSKDFILVTVNPHPMARPKSIHPPTVTAVKVTAATREKIQKEHKRWNSKEPLDRTISRIFDEVQLLRKKAKALNDENIGLAEELRQFIESNKNLLKIQRKQAEEISKYEDELVVNQR